MSRTYRTAQGDRKTIAKQLGENENQPVNLEGRNVQFVARHEDGDKMVDTPAEIVNPRQGRVLYQMTPLETALAGDYTLEWVVTGSTEDPTTYPVKEPAKLVVREDVEQDDLVYDALPEDRIVDTLFANTFNGGVTGNVPLSDITGANLTITNGVLDATDTTRTDEEIQDIVSTLLAAGTNISLTYDDVGNTLTIGLTGNIDAATLDGIDSTQFARTDVAETFAAGVTFDTALTFSDRNADGIGYKLSENATTGELILEETGTFADLIVFGPGGVVNVPTTLNVGGSTISKGVAASGQATLASGTATVDTGVPTTETATFSVALGPATAGADVGAEIRADATSGTYQVDIVESPDTAVGNPAVNYDIIRVR